MISDECWEWRGARTTSGYGNKRMHGKVWLTHRLAWEWAYGPIPNGLHVLHRCDNPPCCNPAHLFLGTNNDNIRDSVSKGRRKGVTRHRPAGLIYRPQSLASKQKRRIIQPEMRVLMRRQRSRGWSFRKIAALHGVCFKTAYKECHGW